MGEPGTRAKQLIHRLIRLGLAIREETRMNIRHPVELSEAERRELTALVGSGKHYARKIKRAQILLAADSGLSDDDIAAAVAVGGSTVYRTKRRFVEGNLEAALNEEPRAGADRKLTGNEEALLIATACSSPPEGRARWTLELLAGAMVKLTDHDSLSRETVRRRLAENHLKPWQKDMWCIPKVDAEYVAWRMCSTSMPSSLTRSGRGSASTKAPASSSAKRVSRSRPRPDGSNASITSIAATAASISLSSLTHIALGAGSRSLVVAPLTTSPSACASSSMSTSQRPSSSASSSTTSPPTPLPLSTPHSHRPKRGACSGGLSSTTRPSTPAGSTWLRSRSACSKANVSIAASKAATGSSPRSTSGRLSETKAALESTGCSPPTRPEPKWRAPIPIPRSKSHDHCAGELGANRRCWARQQPAPFPICMRVVPRRT